MNLEVAGSSPAGITIHRKMSAFMSFVYHMIKTTQYLTEHDHIRYNPCLTPQEWEVAGYDTKYYTPAFEELLNSYALQGFLLDHIEWVPNIPGMALVFLKAELPLSEYDREIDPTYNHFRLLKNNEDAAKVKS